MVICAACEYPNMAGAVFCDQCVELLDAGGSVESAGAQETAAATLLPLLLEDGKSSVFPDAPEECWIALRILDTGVTIPLLFGDEFTLGRCSNDGQVMPDFDLTPFGALDLGVSRVHAVIRRSVAGVRIRDLWSSNGTYLQGGRLKPNVHDALNHGDIVSLSKLRFQILLRDP